MSGRYECRIVSSFAMESVSTRQNYSITRRVVRIGGSRSRTAVVQGTPSTYRSPRCRSSPRNRVWRPSSSSPVTQLCGTCTRHASSISRHCVIAHLRRYVACLASWLVAGPLLGQSQAEVEQDMLVVRDIAHEDADLAVVHLAPVAAPLALDTHRMRPAFGEATGIEGDDPIGCAPPVGHLDQRGHLNRNLRFQVGRV